MNDDNFYGSKASECETCLDKKIWENKGGMGETMC